MSDATTGQRERWLGPGVAGIGTASFLADVGHEIPTALLPNLTATLAAPAAALGLIEGLADGPELGDLSGDLGYAGAQQRLAMAQGMSRPVISFAPSSTEPRARMTKPLNPGRGLCARVAEKGSLDGTPGTSR